MRFREIAGEARRNLTSGTSRALLLAGLLTIIMGGLAWLDISAARAIVREAEEFQASGASTLVLEAPGQVSGRACEALGGLPNVRAAGSMRTTGRTVADALPLQTVPLADVSPGFIAVLGTTPTDAGVVLPTTLAETLGARTGDDVWLDGQQVRVAAIYTYPDDGRRPGFSHIALAPAPVNGTFDQCWVDVWPSSSQVRGLLAATAEGSTNPNAEAPAIGQLNSRLGAAFDGSARFASRATAWAPLAALIGGLLVGFASIRWRRLELTAALHAGVPGAAQAVQMGLEAIAWVGGAILLTLPVIAVGVMGLAWGDAWPLAALGALVVLGGSVGAPLGVVIGVARTRERDLFRYFKTR